MRLHVWPGLNFWFYLAIISSPSCVFSFSAMDFVKKTSGLVFIFLIWILTLLCCAGNVVLSYFYLHPPTNRFFRGYECAGKTTGFLLVVLGNVGLCYFPEKSVACILTFLFLAFYCLCALFCIQPYTGFGALEFLLTASLNPTLRRFGFPSPYSWLVIIACIVIAGIRFTLQPVHPPEQATSDEVDEGQRLRQLEAGLSSPGARLDNNPSPSDIYREPALAGGPTDPLLEDNNPSPSDIYREPALAGGPTDPLLEDNNPSPSNIFREPARAGGPTDPLLEDIKTYNEDPSPPGVQLDGKGISLQAFVGFNMGHTANEPRTFVLKMYLHRKNCAKNVKKFVLNNIKGVDSVDVIDQEEGKVRILGNVEPQKVIKKLKKHMKKHAKLLVEDEEEDSPPKINNQEMQIMNKVVREFVDQRKVPPLLPDMARERQTASTQRHKASEASQATGQKAKRARGRRARGRRARGWPAHPRQQPEDGQFEAVGEQAEECQFEAEEVEVEEHFEYLTPYDHGRA